MKQNKISVQENTEDLPSNELTQDYICGILNDTTENTFYLKAEDISSTSLEPRNELLLYIIAQHFKFNIFIFSTRKKPVFIQPLDIQQFLSEKTMAFGFLSHTDSVLSETTWFGLDVRDNMDIEQQQEEQDDPFNSSNFHAEMKMAGVISVTKKKRFYFDDNNVILNQLEESVLKHIKKSWLDYRKHNSTSKRPRPVEDANKVFTDKENARKNAPTSPLAEAKGIVEANLSEKPDSPTWFADKSKLLRKNHQINYSSYFKKCHSWLDKHFNDQESEYKKLCGLDDSNNGENKDDVEDDSNNGENEDDVEDDDEKDGNTKMTTQYKCITKALGGVLKDDIDYIAFN